MVEEANMQELAQYDPEKLVDLLTERLTFERAGVALYDAIIAKIEASQDEQVQRVVPQLREHRDEEKEHEEWLEAQIRALGGDVDEKTEMARLVETESSGIEQVILDGDNDPSHLFHALLAAELTDNAGWDLLVTLAGEAGDRDAKKAFKQRLHEEEDHLVFVRRAVEGFACHAVLGEALELPAHP
jgi:bacterioferritin (cytochrome b1)